MRDDQCCVPRRPYVRNSGAKICRNQLIVTVSGTISSVADDVMNRLRAEDSGNPRREIPGKLYRGPVIWIVVLLAGWLAISEWPALAGSVLSLAH